MAKTKKVKNFSAYSLIVPAAYRGTRVTLAEWCELIKVEHTVFALPFALSGLVLGSARLPTVFTWLWTSLAFFGARALAMSLNRVIDAEIDARNPRTRTRAIPAGRITKGHAYLFALFSLVLMIWAAAQLPRLCLLLAPLAVLWLSLYSFSKRFTALCHCFLGIALGGAALGGWLAAGGTLLALAPWLLALAVSLWVTGFDIIYACLDVDFDRQEKLLSLPALLGIRNALTISAALHVLTVVVLYWLGHYLNLGATYWIGVTIAAVALAWEHSLITPCDLSKVNAAFFAANGLVSLLVFAAIFADRLLRF